MDHLGVVEYQRAVLWEQVGEFGKGVVSQLVVLEGEQTCFFSW